MIILLDNTVLSNFALVQQTLLLKQTLTPHAATTEYVMLEYETGVQQHQLPIVDWTWLPVLSLLPDEQVLYKHFLEKLNAGEAACLAVAVQRHGRLVTDDRDARKLAAQMQIPTSGTIGILVRLVRHDEITLTNANMLLRQMINHGYWAPIDKIDSLL